jgi:hypothetical protein
MRLALYVHIVRELCCGDFNARPKELKIIYLWNSLKEKEFKLKTIYVHFQAAPSPYASPLQPQVQGVPLSQPKSSIAPEVTPRLSFEERNRLEQARQVAELQKLIDQQQASFKALNVVSPVAQPIQPVQSVVQEAGNCIKV